MKDDLQSDDFVAFRSGAAEVRHRRRGLRPKARQRAVITLDPQVSGYVVDEPAAVALPVDDVQRVVADRERASAERRTATLDRMVEIAAEADMYEWAATPKRTLCGRAILGRPRLLAFCRLAPCCARHERTRTMTETGWLVTFHDLHAASSVEELWGVLLSWHGIRSSTQWEEPYVLFRRFHAEEPAGAVITAALLCTDHRWRTASHHLIVRIVDSGLLAAADELQLAEWFTAPTLGVELEAAEIASVDEPVDLGASSVTVPVGDPDVSVVERSVWPPLRRWAAARLVAQDPRCWRSLLDNASALPSRDGAALAAGVMDATTALPSAERTEAVAAGLASGSGTVRLAALPALAELEGTDHALARAAGDPSAKVRAWTPTVQATAASNVATRPGATVDPLGRQAPGEASLF